MWHLFFTTLMDRKINIAFRGGEKLGRSRRCGKWGKKWVSEKEGEWTRGEKFHARVLLLHLKEVLTSHGRLQRFKTGQIILLMVSTYNINKRGSNPHKSCIKATTLARLAAFVNKLWKSGCSQTMSTLIANHAKTSGHFLSSDIFTTQPVWHSKRSLAVGSRGIAKNSNNHNSKVSFRCFPQFNECFCFSSR